MEKYMEYGFKDFNGNAWNNHMVDGYNAYNRDINATQQPDTIEGLKDRRHQYFMLIMEELRSGI